MKAGGDRVPHGHQSCTFSGHVDRRADEMLGSCSVQLQRRLQVLESSLCLGDVISGPDHVSCLVERARSGGEDDCARSGDCSICVLDTLEQRAICRIARACHAPRLPSRSTPR